MKSISEFTVIRECSHNNILAVNDTVNVLSGKWKVPIIAMLLYGKKRFSELENEIPKINPRMLSRELRDLENNGILTRTVYNTIPATVEYELTQSGRQFYNVLEAMLEWGAQHRKNTMVKEK